MTTMLVNIGNTVPQLIPARVDQRLYILRGVEASSLPRILPKIKGISCKSALVLSDKPCRMKKLM